ncbi:mitochondrial 2-oxoglutarate/malate carrier protein [Hydra vulgaris]|uniref:Mitochondrial 2-oxoglutarate/malate carrier protein n=1 Tax=Hydra vulgaris TaxID=6087 RepID=A0ABM4BRR8_HYDVU
MNVENKPLPTLSRFFIGGAAGMCASSIVHPLDLIKTRMQMSGIGERREHRSIVHTFMSVMRREGPLAFYNGISATLFRNASYTSVRLGVFTNLKEYYKESNGELHLFKNVIIAILAGASGAFIGTPAEIALVRMTSDGALPQNQRRQYKNVFIALQRITREEGIMTLWRGCQPTIIRAVIVNSVQLTTYTQTKQLFLSKEYFNDNIKCHVASSAISGFLSTVASLPADIIKTRMQTSSTKKSYLSILSHIVKKEGFFALWKGFTPCYLRMGPQSILVFVFLEQFQYLAQMLVTSY